MTVLDGGDLEFYVARSKTDQKGHGFIFHVTGERYKGFSIPEVLYWYLESTGLTGRDYLFPRFRNERQSGDSGWLLDRIQHFCAAAEELLH